MTVFKKVPDVAESKLPPFDYLVCTTKIVADVPPALTELIAPAVTLGHTVIVLLQNGLNIEKPFHAVFPENVCLSGVSKIGANEPTSGHITVEEGDQLFIAPFAGSCLDPTREKAAAEKFVQMHAASGKVKCSYEADVAFVRWRKLVYNAVWNPVCALTDVDPGRIRLASDPNDPYNPVDLVVIPAMKKVRAAAKAAAGIELPETIIFDQLDAEPIDGFVAPSMQQDMRKGRYTEYENILGQALKEGEGAGVSMPIIRTLYALCKARQWGTMERQGVHHAQELANARGFGTWKEKY